MEVTNFGVHLYVLINESRLKVTTWHTVGSPTISVTVSGDAQAIPKEQFPFSEPFQSNGMISH